MGGAAWNRALPGRRGAPAGAPRAPSAGEIPDLLLVLEHPPVYTKGRRTEPGDLPMGEDWYRAQGIDVCETDRGGRVTYHGPGQLVAYPIMEVDRVADFVHTMEGAIVAALPTRAIAAEPRDTPFTGVWVGDSKIASIGVRVSGGVSTHGLAVNVDNDLQPFDGSCRAGSITCA